MARKEERKSVSDIICALGLIALLGPDILYDMPGRERDAAMSRSILIIMSFVFLLVYVVNRNWQAEFKRNLPMNQTRGNADASGVE